MSACGFCYMKQIRYSVSGSAFCYTKQIIYSVSVCGFCSSKADYVRICRTASLKTNTERAITGRMQSGTSAPRGLLSMCYRQRVLLVRRARSRYCSKSPSRMKATRTILKSGMRQRSVRAPDRPNGPRMVRVAQQMGYITRASWRNDNKLRLAFR